MNEIEFNNKIFEFMPDILYHGSIGHKYTKNDFLNRIKIFNNVEQYNNYIKENNLNRNDIRRKIGRINLDGGFNGIYFTPCESVARKWAKRVVGKKGQIIKVKVNKEMLIKSGIIIKCLPSIEWAKFIIHNRKYTTYENIVDCSYSLQLDSKLKNNTKLLNNIQSCNLNEINFLDEMYHDFFNKYYLGNNEWDFENLLKDRNILDGMYFQLCISSQELLNCIEVLDIINIDERRRQDE